MQHDRENFLSFWAIFCFFTLLTTWIINILKKWKKNTGDIIILHKFTKNRDYMQYCFWDMVHDGSNFYFLFWAIFCEETSADIIILHMCTKIWWCGERQTDWKMNREKEKVIYRGGCPPRNKLDTFHKKIKNEI